MVYEAVGLGNGQEYSRDQVTWSDGSGQYVPVSPKATVYIRVAATDSAFVGWTQTITAPDRLAKPNVTIDYVSETISTTEGMRWVYDHEREPCGNNMSITFLIGNAEGPTVEIWNHATGTAYSSEHQYLTIPARPAAPNAAAVAETVDGRNDGKITGVSTTMEWHSGEGEWLACTGTEITGLAPGTYQVRALASQEEGKFTSQVKTVTVGKGVERTYTLTVSDVTFDALAYGYTQPAAKTIPIASTGNWDSTIESVTASSEKFVITGTDTTVPYGGKLETYTIRPVAGLAAGDHEATITVTYNGGATASATVRFTVTRAEMETVSFDLTAPVAEDTPQTRVSGTGFTGLVTWNPAVDAFVYDTQYTATVTLTPDDNHVFTGDTTAEGYDVRYNSDGTLTLTRTFTATVRAKIQSLSAPKNVTLKDHCAAADTVIDTLPTTVAITAEDGTTSLGIGWAVEGTYDSTPNAVNTFRWTADVGNLDAANVETSGTITVTNPDYLPVTHAGADETITYDETTYDVGDLFTLDENAGIPTYSVVGGTGAGSLNGSILTITRAGTIEIKLETAVNGFYGTGSATAQLTVNKAEGTGSVTMEGWTYGGESKNPASVSATNGVEGVTFRYKTVDGKTYAAQKPTNAGSYTVKVIFPETDLYNGFERTADFTIQPKAITAAVRAEDKVYDGNTTAAVTATVDTGVAGETLTISGLTGTFADANAGGDKTVTVNTGKITYSGANEKNYVVTIPATAAAKITPRDITDAVVGKFDAMTYNGKAQSPAAAVTVDGLNVTGSWSKVTNVTDKTSFTASGNFTGKLENVLPGMAKKDITGAAVGKFDAMTYNGEAQTPAAAVTVDGLSVTGSWSNVTNVTDETSFTANGNFTGTIAGQKTGMARKPITGADVALDGEVIYNGQTQTQKVTVTEGITYEIQGNTQSKAGEYTLTVTGTGNYTGKVTLNWSIM